MIFMLYFNQFRSYAHYKIWLLVIIRNRQHHWMRFLEFESSPILVGCTVEQEIRIFTFCWIWKLDITHLCKMTKTEFCSKPLLLLLSNLHFASPLRISCPSSHRVVLPFPRFVTERGNNLITKFGTAQSTEEVT